MLPPASQLAVAIHAGMDERTSGCPRKREHSGGHREDAVKITEAGGRLQSYARDRDAFGRRVMKMEWMRAGDSTPACWACFMIFDDHADVLAVTGPNERIDAPIPSLPLANCGMI